MRLPTAAVWAFVGVIGSSAAAMAVPLSTRTAAPRERDRPVTTTGAPTSNGAVTATAEPRFHAERTLSIDARLGHDSIALGNPDAKGETFLLASIAGADRPDRASAPMNLAIVIDRSGSMKGPRMANALAAATGIVERMRDGDRVTVVSFDDAAEVVVPPTLASSATRASIESDIRAIRPGGDTCMSCGLESAMRALEGARVASDEIDRAILLSDGAANRGVRDGAGLRAIAARMRDRGCAVTTIGLDVDFDQKVMAAIASESNGHHYFVADVGDLAQVFDREFDALLATVARDAELVIEPAAGVEIVEVFDRAFRREGDRIVVPFGTFGSRQEKTALMRVRVPADRDGVEPVASLSLRWRDLVARTDETLSGSLSLAVAPAGQAQKDVDPFVAARLARSRTARTLTDANLLFEQGRGDAARRELDKHEAELRQASAHASAVAKSAAIPKPQNALPLDRDFAAQLDAIATARSGFAQPPASPFAGPSGAVGGAGLAARSAAAAPEATRAGKKAVRENQSKATDLAF